MSTLPSSSPTNLVHLPIELQVNWLTYLRAYDLASVAQTCRYYADASLTDAIVRHASERVYPEDLTRGFAKEPVSIESPTFTYEHLRNMELLVIARVLARPEPPLTAGAFIVSKSWCKAALKWLEVQQAPQRRLSKKKQRQRHRRLSDASPPWPNVNADLLCEHARLRRCSNKSARARRRMLDTDAWKVLSAIYPDSTAIAADLGECRDCLAAAQASAADAEARRLEELRQRKLPLAHPLVRGVYTRTRGVPVQALHNDGPCPLVAGRYHVLSRAWCHGWRRYLKTGTGPVVTAPDAGELLCDAHRLPLVPPHLEAFLYGQCAHLFQQEVTTTPVRVAAATRPVMGPALDLATVEALRAAGLGETEVQRQLAAMRLLEQQPQQQQPQQQPPRSDKNTALDRENHAVVEILTEDEFTALLRTSWPSIQVFSVCFTVDNHGAIDFGTDPCRACDATGRASLLSIKNRARGWVKRSSGTARAPASLEY